MRLRTTISYAFGAIALAWASAAAAQYNPETPPNWAATPLPAAFRYDAPALTPLTVTIPNITVAGPSLVRDVRLDEMSAALQHDGDKIYEYVHNEIQTTPTFGLTKGAFGAMLDQAGNPFDQAHLMVTLMDAADVLAARGYNAQYAYGSLTQTHTEFAANFGPNSARGACELLAAGGVPATINGTTSVCSTYTATPGSFSVVMRHVWVRATIGGVNYLFDPSLKAQPRVAPRAAIAAAVPAGSTLQSATVAQTVEEPTVQQYTGYNPASLRTALNAATTAVRTAIGNQEAATTATTVPGFATISTNAALSMEQAIGGATSITPQVIYGIEQAQRLTTLPGHTQVNLWAEIPTSLRTFVHLQVQGDASLAKIVVSKPAADLAGRRLIVVAENAAGVDNPNSVTARVLLDEKIVTGAGGAQAQAVIQTGVGWTGSPMIIRAAVHHPFHGATTTANAFAQSLYYFEVTNAFPTPIILGLGERGDGAELRNTAVISEGGIINWAIDQPCYYPPGQPVCEIQNPIVTQRAAQTSSAVAASEGFLTHSSRLLDVYEGLAGGRRAPHHMIGVAALSINVNTRAVGEPPPEGPFYKNQLVGQQLTLDISGRMGFAPFSSTSKTRQGFALASAGALSALEQTILRSASDTPSTAGTASMFEWFTTATRAQAYNQSTSTLPRNQIRFLQIPDSTQSAARADAATLLWFSPGTPPANPHPDHASFTIVAPQSGRLGPVRRAFRTNFDGTGGTYLTSFPCASTASCTILDFDHPENAYVTRAAGYLAYQIGAASIAVAPIAQGQLKGGAGANFQEGIEAPSTDREGIDKAYETWATNFDVDLRTGGLTLSPSPDLTTGAGGYPYSLEFQRTYSSDRDKAGTMGLGWTHNLDVRLSTGTDVGQALGEDSPRHALATIVAAQATLDLLSASTNVSRDLVTAMLVQNWWSDSLFDNQATITRGAGSERFILQPDGVWQPEVGSTVVISRTGTRLAEANQTTGGGDPDPLYRTVSEAFDRKGWVFTYTGADGLREVFNYGFDLTLGTYAPEYASAFSTNFGTVTHAIGSGSTFLRASSVLPFGVTVNYTYATISDTYGTLGKRLDRVYTGAPFNRSIYLEYEQASFATPEAPDDQGSYSLQTNLSDPRFRLIGARSEQSARRVDFDYTTGQLTSFTDLMGATHTYSSADYAYEPDAGYYMEEVGGTVTRLTGLRLPHDPSNNFLSFGYDTTIRTTSVTNRRAEAWRYWAGERSRGRTRDPLSWDAFEFYDREGRLTAAQTGEYTISETRYDGIGRRVRTAEGQWTLAPGDRRLIREYFYDANHNPVLERQRTQTDATGAHLSGANIDRISEYGYSAAVSGVTTFRSLKTRDIDPEGHATRYCFHSTQSGCTGVQAGTHNGLLRATFGPSGEDSRTSYDTYGRASQNLVKATATETRQTDRVYGTNGLPSTITVVNPATPNLVTTLAWDTTGNLLTVTDAGGRRTRGAYRNDRRLSQMTVSDHLATSAMVTRYRYDASHRLQYLDEAGTVTGSAGSLVGSNWATTELVYTTWGKIDRIIDPAGDADSFVYLDNDLIQESKDGENRRTRFDYLADSSVYCTRTAYGTAEVRTQRRTSNDFTGEPTRWWTGNQVSGCTPESTFLSRTLFDNWYRSAGHLFPDATDIVSTLSPAGNVTATTTRANQPQSFDYDASNRVTEETFPEGVNTYGYNLAGERISASWTGSGYTSGLTHAYDFAGRLIEERRTQDNLPVNYEYDGSGNRTAIRWPDGWTARYAYDGASRLVTVCEDSDGLTTTGTSGITGCNQILASYAWDRRGRRDNLRFHGAITAGTSGIDYGYAVDSDLTSLAHTFTAATAVTFTHGYDASGRLTATETGSPGWLWTAGGIGFTRAYANDFTAAATNDLDQVRSYVSTGGITGTVNLTHDLNGNMATRGPTTYTHDSRNRLTQVVSTLRGGGWNPPVSTSATWSMRYDPDGRRIRYTSSATASETVETIHAGDMEIADLSTVNGNVLRRYVPAVETDDRVAMIVTNAGAGAGGTPNVTNGREYYHADRQGHVIAMIRQDGTQAARYIYTPYGVEEPWNVSGQPFRYTGRRRDGEIGLYHYRARYYDPQLGRFIETDPVRYQDQMNLYGYVSSDPFSFLDPMGRQQEENWLSRAMESVRDTLFGETAQDVSDRGGSTEELGEAIQREGVRDLSGKAIIGGTAIASAAIVAPLAVGAAAEGAAPAIAATGAAGARSGVSGARNLTSNPTGVAASRPPAVTVGQRPASQLPNTRAYADRPADVPTWGAPPAPRPTSGPQVNSSSLRIKISEFFRALSDDFNEVF